jgi:hypothetical protein
LFAPRPFGWLSQLALVVSIFVGAERPPQQPEEDEGNGKQEREVRRRTFVLEDQARRHAMRHHLVLMFVPGDFVDVKNGGTQ